ncbi:hypothetical protein [Bradyrhizobium liaoningense]|uniref:hypothetical protein n=1 Tax=Bradyrhizobium liaoningense TaxID=43992 RepID=UPI001BAD409B|nr:hypothetical protein [Bradyrhizobium liaoningense]MBR1069678.1 hypothetical protein [Bradyrhizobium liaoningense]
MNASDLLKVALLYHRSFLAIFGLSFAGLLLFVLTVPKQLVAVKTVVQVPTSFTNGKPEPLESADQIAGRAAMLYGPAAIDRLQSSGAASPAVVTALLGSGYDGAGKSVVLSSTIDSSAEQIARNFQQTVAKAIIADVMPAADAARQRAEQVHLLATEKTENLTKQLAVNEKRIQSIGGLIDDLWDQSENLRSELSKTYQSARAALDSELKIREVREQRVAVGNLAMSAMNERSNLTAQNAALQREKDAATAEELKTRLEAQLFRRPAISDTTITPATSSYRRLSLIAMAFVISVLVAFAAVGLAHTAGRFNPSRPHH